MSTFVFKPTAEIEIHKKQAIELITAPFRSHENGLPEWVKNSADAYVREGYGPSERVIVLLFDNGVGRQERPMSIGCLDFVGMSSWDIEEYFRRWADPEASTRGDAELAVSGGHGNGGKAYMTRMFDAHAYLYTVKGESGNVYGVSGKSYEFDFVRDERDTPYKDFVVSSVSDELNFALSEMGATISDLPQDVQDVAWDTSGFTLVRGVNPIDYTQRIPTKSLVESLIAHPQMISAMNLCSIYVVVDGKAFNNGQPIRPRPIEPMQGSETPRVIPIPETLRDPHDKRTRVSTTDKGRFPLGSLILYASEKTMRSHHRKYRHNIHFKGRNGFVGMIEVKELGLRSSYWDHIYGTCELAFLDEYTQNERRNLAEAPLTRALQAWISREADKYAQEFEKRDARRYSHEAQQAIKDINRALDKWKNQFLQEIEKGFWGGEGPVIDLPTPPLPRAKVAKMQIALTHTRAGLGVSLRPVIKFYDRDGQQVRSIPHVWQSDDYNVAYIDDDLGTVKTASPGIALLHAETLDGALKSNQVLLEVVHTIKKRIEPSEITLASGSRHKLRAVCTLESEEETDDMYLIWTEENEAVARVTPAGVVFGYLPGTTEVYVGDDSGFSDAGATIQVVPSKSGEGEGDEHGRGFPRVLVSSIDSDPETDEPVHFSSEVPPVYQRPRDYERGIWWINSSAPLAKLYLDNSRGFGYESRAWRIYHVERILEVMARILLEKRAQVGEISNFELWQEGWSQIAATLQEKAVDYLAGFIQNGDVGMIEDA